MLDAINLEKHFVHMPLVADLGSSPLQLGRIRLAELVAPTPDRLVAELHSAGGHHQLDISQAQTETEEKPNSLGDDFLGKGMAAVRIGRHPASIACHLQM